MGLSAIEGLSNNIALYDTYLYNDEQKVVISCKNRLEGSSSIKAKLMSPLTVSVTASWQGLDSLGGVGQVLNAVNAVSVAIKGVSISQPWFSRKFWKSTEPIKLSAKLGFYAHSSSTAYSDVYLPCNKLIGLCYPRQVSGDSGSELLALYAPPGPNIFTGYNTKTGQVTSGMFSGSLTAAGTENVDYVSFTLGKLVVLDICYLDRVDVAFSSSLNSEGYPLSAAVDVAVTAMDVGIWQESGVFLKQQSGVALNLGEIVDAAKGVVSDAIEEGKAALNIGKKSNDSDSKDD